MTPKLATFPAVFEIVSPELFPLTIDFSKRLGVSDAVTGVYAVTITNPLTGALMTTALAGSAGFSTTAVTTPTINPANLPQLPTDVYYELLVTALIGGRRESTITKLKVLI
jgi:hypothetical protein